MGSRHRFRSPSENQLPPKATNHPCLVRLPPAQYNHIAPARLPSLESPLPPTSFSIVAECSPRKPPPSPHPPKCISPPLVAREEIPPPATPSAPFAPSPDPAPDIAPHLFHQVPRRPCLRSALASPSKYEPPYRKVPPIDNSPPKANRPTPP